MKRIINLLLLLPLLSGAQSLIGGNNIIKGNLSAYSLGNFGLTYERHIAPHLTASIGISKMPARSLPFQNEIEKQFSSSVIDYGNVTVGNFSFTPELRFYILGGMRGFYLAPYLRYSSMDLFVPIKYSTNASNSYNKKADFSGIITSTSGGLMIGTQHQLFKKLVIDIWILGAHYGSGHGDINATYTPTDPNPNSQTSKYEKASIQNGINSINPSPFKVSSTVSSTTPTAQIKVDGAWGGIRALGINLGIRF